MRAERGPLRPTPSQLSTLARRDPRLGALLERLPPFPDLPDAQERRRSHFESLARAIVHQQLAGAAAATIWSRVCRLGGGRRLLGPTRFLELDETELAGAGLSRNKRLALRDLAGRLARGELRLAAAQRLPDEELVRRLVEVRGIGVWSAQMFLLFKLGRLDVLPATDLGVQEGLRLLDGLDERPTPAAVLERAERWRPLASVGSWAMWRRVELERSRGGAR